MQQLFKNIICFLYDNNLCDTAYFTLQFIALMVSFCCGVGFSRNFKIPVRKAVVAIVAEVAAVYIEMALLCILVKRIVPAHIPVMNTYYNNVGRTFILVPFSAMVLSVLLKEDFKVISNIIAFTQPMIWGLASIACLFAGCCQGIPWKWGIYNAWESAYLFPTQLLNAVALVGVALYISRRSKKKRYVPDGIEYAIALILIGIVRFFTEFLMDNDKIIFGLSSLSFDAGVMCIVGSFWIIINKHLLH